MSLKIKQQKINREIYNREICNKTKQYRNKYEIDIIEYVLKVLYSKTYFDKCLNEALLRCHLAGRKLLEDNGSSYYEMLTKYNLNTFNLIPKYNKDLWKIYENGYDKQWSIEHNLLYSQNGIYKIHKNHELKTIC